MTYAEKQIKGLLEVFYPHKEHYPKRLESALVQMFNQAMQAQQEADAEAGFQKAMAELYDLRTRAEYRSIDNDDIAEYAENIEWAILNAEVKA